MIAALRGDRATEPEPASPEALPSRTMSPAIALRRLGYRVAYRLLRLVRPLLVWREGGGVKCVLLDPGPPRRVLLVRHTYGPRAWDLPGGGRKRGEPPADAARRETREELGLEIADWRDGGAIHGRVDRHRQTVHILRADVGAPRPRLALAELSASGWFELDRLPLELGTFVAPILDACGLRAGAA